MRFAGSYPALVTPFDKDGRIDEDAYRALIRRQIAGGSAGLVPCGSTGESATLTPDERRRCLHVACEESRGDVPVIAGIGTNSTWRTIEEAREAELAGADALLVLAPYYNKPTQEGLYQHFRAIARQTRLPIVVYNIPGRSAVNILPKTLARLAEDCPNIQAVKEASGSLDQVSELLCTSRLSVLSGDDSLTLPMLAVGATGVISVVANVAPRMTAELVRSRSAKLHLRLFPLIKLLFVETNPIPVKTALSMLGLCRPEPRLPLTPLSREHHAALRAALKRTRPR